MTLIAIPDPVRLVCPHCGGGDTEAVIETARGWGCYCNGCGKTFPVAKTDSERAAEREEGMDR